VAFCFGGVVKPGYLSNRELVGRYFVCKLR
jgi:hypothetical protein